LKSKEQICSSYFKFFHNHLLFAIYLFVWEDEQDWTETSSQGFKFNQRTTT